MSRELDILTCDCIFSCRLKCQNIKTSNTAVTEQMKIGFVAVTVGRVWLCCCLSHPVLPVLSVDLFVLQYLNNQIAAWLCDCWTFHDITLDYGVPIPGSGLQRIGFHRHWRRWRRRAELRWILRHILPLHWMMSTCTWSRCQSLKRSLLRDAIGWWISLLLLFLWTTVAWVIIPGKRQVSVDQLCKQYSVMHLV